MNKGHNRLETVLGTTVIMVILLVLVPSPAIADGMAFRYDPVSSLEPLEVNEQRAIIAHKDGIQRMFISIKLGDSSSNEQANKSAIWIFPVPGGTGRADVEVTDFVPELTGDEVKRIVREATFSLLIPIVSQPHILPFAVLGFHAFGTAGVMPAKALGVTTHKQLDRWGIHAELIAANSVEALADYLRKKKVEVKPERLSPFADYLSDKYALVMAWISSYDELIKKFPQFADKQASRRPSLYVEFPTEKPFYPVRPTSGYGKKAINVTLYIVGWVTPDVSAWTDSEKKAVSPYVDYYAGKTQVLRSSYRTFLSAQEEKEKVITGNKDSVGQGKAIERFLSAVPEGKAPFTLVQIRAPAENFTRDLLFIRASRVYVMHAIASSQWGLASVVIALLVVLSSISGGISGKVIFGEWKPWVRIGLWNCLTIVGLVVAAWLTRRDLIDKDKCAPVSARWEALVFGFLASVPMSALVGTISRFDTPPRHGWIFQALQCLLVAALLLMSSWIVSKSRFSSTDRVLPDDEVNRSFLPCGIKESLFRVFLMLVPLALFSLPLLSVRFGNTAGMILSTSLTIIVLFIPLAACIVLGLFTVSWIVRKVGSALSATKKSVFFGQKTQSLILGSLTSIVAILMVTTIVLFQDQWPDELLIRFGCYGLITGLLLIATWLVWKGTSCSFSMESRLLPTWPIAISVLAPLLVFCGTFISLVSVLTAVCFIGIMVGIGFICWKHIVLFYQKMTYGSALSTIFLILGVVSYFAVLEQFLAMSGFIMKIWTVTGDALAVLALLSATWLIKRHLQESIPKVLRFGLLFSVVFTLLNIAVHFGLKTLLSYSGI